MKKNKIKKIAMLVVLALILIFAIFFSKSEWAYFVNLLLMLTEVGLIVSTFGEKHNALKFVLVTTLCLMIFTWLIPAAYFSGTYQEAQRTQMGLFELFNYPVTSLSYFGYIALFVLLIGGFYGIMYKIPAYRNFLDKIINSENGLRTFSLVVVGCVSLVIFLFSIFVVGFKAKLLLYLLLALIPLILVYLLFKLITGKEGRNILFLGIMMVVIAFAVSVSGIQIALALFFPLLISLILLMGYDKITAAMVTVGSAMVGIMGSTYAYSNTNIINSVLGLSMSSEIIAKFVILAIGLILLVFNVKLYISKNCSVKEKKDNSGKKMTKVETKTISVSSGKSSAKNNKAKTNSKNTKTSKPASKSSKKAGAKSSKGSRRDYKAAAKDNDVIVVKNVVDDEIALVPEEISSRKRTSWPFVVGLVFAFLVVILAFVSWTEAFSIDAFTKATTSVTGYELFKFPIFGKLLGTVNAFGAWTLVDLMVIMCVVTLLVCVVYKVKMNDVFDGFINGVKKTLPISILVIVIYTCLVITTYHPFQLVLYKFILGAGSKMNLFKIFQMSLTAILAGFFNVEPLYSFQSVLPYLASLDFAGKHYPLIGVIFQSLYGLTMLIAPTSIVLIGVLSYLNVSIKKWFKAIWKLLLELLIVLLVLFIILLVV